MPAQQDVTLLLPVKPYLKQFLATSFGPVLNLSNNSIISVYILVCLEGKRHTAYSEKQLQAGMAPFSDKYCLKLPRTKLYLNGLHISHHNVIFINRILDEFFDQQLYLHMERGKLGSVGRYFGYQKLLRDFISKYNIEEDDHISFDALVKREQRYKMKIRTVEKKQEESLQNLSSPVENRFPIPDTGSFAFA